MNIVHKVHLTYFKPDTGKYYTSGEFDYTVDGIDHDSLGSIWTHVALLAAAKSLPGLLEGSHGWIISIDVPSHPNNHPKILLPEKQNQIKKRLDNLSTLVKSAPDISLGGMYGDVNIILGDMSNSIRFTGTDRETYLKIFVSAMSLGKFYDQ